MFEQSLLIDHAGGRKTATFAASLTAQILVAGVLLVVPLFYHEVLPVLRVPDTIFVAGITPAPTPATPHTTARSNALALPGVFRPPIPIRSDYPLAGPMIVDAGAPALPATSDLAPFPIGSATTLPQATSVKPDVMKPPDTPVRVGGDVQSANLIKRVVPAYPQPARQVRVSGTVRLLGVIAKDGTIQRLQVLSGHPLLRQAAIDAVRQWVYRPTFLNGQPVEVEAPIDVIFTLQ
jgi:protein TonB